MFIIVYRNSTIQTCLTYTQRFFVHPSTRSRCKRTFEPVYSSPVLSNELKMNRSVLHLLPCWHGNRKTVAASVLDTPSCYGEKGKALKNSLKEQVSVRSNDIHITENVINELS